MSKLREDVAYEVASKLRRMEKCPYSSLIKHIEIAETIVRCDLMIDKIRWYQFMTGYSDEVPK